MTELWTFHLTYTCKVIVTHACSHPQIECIFSSQCGFGYPACFCWPSARSGLVPEIQSQLCCSRERGILGCCHPAFLLIAWARCQWAENWLLGEQGAHGDWIRVCVGVCMAVCYQAADRDCSLVWCMSFFRSECEWMGVITVFTMARYKMDYFQ